MRAGVNHTPEPSAGPVPAKSGCECPSLSPVAALPPRALPPRGLLRVALLFAILPRFMPAELLGVKATVYAPRAPDPLNRAPWARMDVRTTAPKLLIVRRTPNCSLSRSLPSYYDGSRRIDGLKPNAPRNIPRETPMSLALSVVNCIFTADEGACNVGYKGCINNNTNKFNAKAVNPRSLPRSYIITLNL